MTTETIADLAITKTLTGPAIPGLATTYTIVVTNLGPSPVTAASVTDTFPLALARADLDLRGRRRIELRRRLGHGQSRDHRHARGRRRCDVHRDGDDRGERDRPARQHGDRHGAGRRRRSGYDQQHGDQFGDADALRRLSRSPRRAPLTAVAGTNVVYTITVTNAGPSDATGVTLTDPTPPGLTFVSNTGDCTTAFPCNLGTLPPAATRTITATFAVPSGYTTPNPIVNTATVSSATPPAISTSATTNTPVAAPVTDLHITKTNGVNGVVAGLPTTYTITDHQPARAERREWRDGHRHLPDDADRRHVDVHGHGRRRVPRVGQRRHQHVRDGAGRRERRLHRHRHGRSRGHGRPRQLGPGAPARGPRQPDVGDRHRQRPDHRARRPGASPRPGRRPSSPAIRSSTRSRSPTAGPSDAAGVVVSDATPAGLVFVSNAGDCTTAFPCALGVVPAGAHPHDHRDVHGAAHVSRPGPDRERRQRVGHHAR